MQITIQVQFKTTYNSTPKSKAQTPKQDSKPTCRPRSRYQTQTQHQNQKCRFIILIQNPNADPSEGKDKAQVQTKTKLHIKMQIRNPKPQATKPISIVHTKIKIPRGVRMLSICSWCNNMKSVAGHLRMCICQEKCAKQCICKH